jgi:hypothetical protein
LKNKILIVHPSSAYDSENLTRDVIIDLAKRYDLERIDVLEDYSGDSLEYLRRNELAKHASSALGEFVGTEYLHDLLNDCERLTICGHTGNACHHTSFEQVLRGFELSNNASLAIQIPTYAVSSDRGYDTGKTMRADILELEKSIPKTFGFPPQLERYHECFLFPLTPREKATIVELLQYLKPVVNQAFSLDLHIDGRLVFQNQNDKGKKLSLFLQNEEVVQ